MITLKQQVEYCLQKHPETRNSDTKLMNAVFIEFFNSFLSRDDNNNYIVKLLDLYNLPNPANITRYRQKFNENGRFMPTNPEVIKARKQNEIIWREEMSPSNPSRG